MLVTLAGGGPGDTVTAVLYFEQQGLGSVTEYAFAVTLENEAIQSLGTLGWNRSFARGVSADGSVAVGISSASSSVDQAFRWTAAGGMLDLGPLRPWRTYSENR